jgi:3-deoxy-D-manno-octulosonic-acid transferase
MAAIVSAFTKAYPAYRVMISTMTTTGLTHARQMIPGPHLFCLFPYDVPIIMRRTFARLRPQVLILVEGEIWPSLLNAAQRAGCPIALVNGRMSDRSYPRNKLIKPLMRDMLSKLSLAGAQTPLDAERFVEFGAHTDRVVVTGNVKIDRAVLTSRHSRTELRHALGLSESAPVVIAGCPRPVEEEEAILHAMVAVHARFQDVKIIWAPRHLDRLPEVERMLRSRRLSWIRRSKLDGTTPVEQSVILLDTIGELSALYAVADVAFVGATLVPLGGHNLLEPAVYGIPVLFGPHTENVRASAGALLLHGGGMEVQDGTELAAVLIRLLENPDERQRIGLAAAKAVQSGDGALERTMALLKERIF